MYLEFVSMKIKYAFNLIIGLLTFMNESMLPETTIHAVVNSDLNVPTSGYYCLMLSSTRSHVHTHHAWFVQYTDVTG